MSRFSAGIDATTQLEQTDLRHTTALVSLPTIFPSKEFESVRDLSESPLRFAGEHFQQSTSEIVQSDIAGIGSDQRGVSAAHRGHNAVALATGQDLSIAGVVIVAFRHASEQNGRVLLAGEQSSVRDGAQYVRANFEEGRVKN